ncbi:MAG: choice-of-anchor D domain-containing protein [Verrucomicrobiota bacterium]
MRIYHKRGFLFILFLLIAMSLAWITSRQKNEVYQSVNEDPERKNEAVSVSENAPITSDLLSDETTSNPLSPDLIVASNKIERGLNNRREFSKPQKVDLTLRESRLFGESPVTETSILPSTSQHYNSHTLHLVASKLNKDFPNRFIESNSDRFRLSLDGINEIEIEIDEALVRGQATHTLKGSVAGHPTSDVLIVFNGDAMGGSVVFHADNQHFEFGASGEGSILIRKLDPMSYNSPCGNNAENADELSYHAECDADHSTASSTDAIVEAAQSSGPGTAGTIIDTVVGYGQAARIEDGGVDAIEARILASVDRNNEAFVNSEIEDIEIVLMATIEDPNYVFPGRIDGNMGTNDELGDLRDPFDGSLDTVTDLVDELGADHEAFVVKEADGAAGIAYRPGYSMITARDYMSSTALVFAHEMGHNIGCRHAWADSGSDQVSNINNYGWRFITPILGERKTIMAYSSWSRVNYYSNPDVLIDGVRTGAVDGYDASGDTTVDPDLVSGGYIGTAGVGYDGSNPSLGANNAAYIQNNAWYLAIGNDRRIPSIQIESPSGSPIDHLFGSILFDADTLSDVVSKTLTIRNNGSTTIGGLLASLERNDLGAFSLGNLGATSLVAGATTTIQVSFTPADEEAESVDLRIESTTGDSLDVVINLDGIYDPPLPIIQVEYPSGQPLISGSGNISFTASEIGEAIERVFTITNIGELELNSLSATFDTNPSGEFAVVPFGAISLASGESTTLTVTYTPVEVGLKTPNLEISSNDPEVPEFTVPLFGSLDGPIYAESFENGFGLWTNTGERDWTLRTGRTPSGLTGPNSAHDGDYYIFTEATASGSDLFIVEAAFDLSSYSTAELRFRYHMYGSWTGTIWVDVNIGSGWDTDVWSLTDQQQSNGDAPWGLATVDLTSYAGSETVTIRFRGQTRGISRSDMAIDAIELSAEASTYTLTYTADTGGSISGTTTQTLSQGQDGSPVVAVPEDGFLFLDWSDGSTENPRTDTNIQSNGDFLARFRPETITRFSDWLLGLNLPEGLDGPEDSLLSDGIPNLIRYAFNIEPTETGPVVLTPESGGSGTPWVTFPEAPGEGLSIEFVRRRNAIDLIYRVEFSNNLEANSWTQFDGDESVEIIGSDWERVTVVDTITSNDQSRRFVRVAVDFIED